MPTFNMELHRIMFQSFKEVSRRATSTVALNTIARRQGGAIRGITTRIVATSNLQVHVLPNPVPKLGLNPSLSTLNKEFSYATRTRSLSTPISSHPPSPESTTSATSTKSNTTTTTTTSTSSSSNSTQPQGNLFNAKIYNDSSPSSSLLHKIASIKRTFTAQSNAQAMLICGGPILAAHSSFDPEYSRARDYIRNHAVGPAVVQPVLINGLIGTLVEAALPSSFFIKSDVCQLTPLIVGVEVEASIKVIQIKKGNESTTIASHALKQQFNQTQGYEVVLKTQVKRVLDDEIISEGDHHVWLPDYS